MVGTAPLKLKRNEDRGQGGVKRGSGGKTRRLLSWGSGQRKKSGKGKDVFRSQSRCANSQSCVLKKVGAKQSGTEKEGKYSLKKNN